MSESPIDKPLLELTAMIGFNGKFYYFNLDEGLEKSRRKKSIRSLYTHQCLAPAQVTDSYKGINSII